MHLTMEGYYRNAITGKPDLMTSSEYLLPAYKDHHLKKPNSNLYNIRHKLPLNTVQLATKATLLGSQHSFDCIHKSYRNLSHPHLV